MADNIKEPFFSKGFITQNVIGIFLMIMPSYIKIPELWAAIIFWGCASYLIGLLFIHIRGYYRLLPSILIIPYGRISLSEAAQIAYDEFRGYAIGTMSEKVFDRNPLRFLACSIADQGVLWGKHFPSKKFEIVNKEQMGVIQEGGKYTTDIGNTAKLYIDLMVERKHLKEYIRDIKKIIIN